MIIFGTKNVKRRVKGGLCIKKYCPKCRRRQELQEFNWKTYFTLYFIPVFPIDLFFRRAVLAKKHKIERGESVLTCTTCDSDYVLQPEDYIEGSNSASKTHQAEPERERIVINCIHCNKKLRIPNLSKTINVTCPHCNKKFEVRPRD